LIPASSVDDVIARIATAIDSVGVERAALATDGDGTLWTHDIGEALFEAVLDEGYVGEAALASLLAEADAHGVELESRDDAARVARTLFQAYVALKYPEDRMCAAITWCMAGTSTFALARYCDDMLDRRFGLIKRFIAESHAILRYVASRNVPVWLVSASPLAVVEAAARVIAREVSIPMPNVIAMTPSVEHDVIRPSIVGIWTYGEGKREALNAALGDRQLVAAMGDNVFDVPMLQAAKVPIAIRPKPALVNVAGQVPGLVTLAGARG
jgi:phosphatidylglycerophosphatase C